MKRNSVMAVTVGVFFHDRPGRSRDWLKFKNPAAPAVKREAEEEWGKVAVTTRIHPLIVFLVVLLGAFPISKTHAAGRDYFGVGGDSCAVWIDARAKRNTSSHGSWVLGYVSALNLWNVIGQRKDALKNTDGPAIYLWIDNYCRANPLENIATAAGALARELNDRASR
jgi:hypothetical protein